VDGRGGGGAPAAAMVSLWRGVGVTRGAWPVIARGGRGG
jgi:hypothetical protein